MEPTTPPTDRPAHPLQRCVSVLAGALDEVAGVDPIYADAGVKADLLVGLARVEERVHAVRLAVLAGAEDLAVRDGVRSVGAWQAHHTREDRRTCARDQKLAEALAWRWTDTGAALAAGEVNRHQAAAIVHALDELPGGLEPELVVKAEEFLLDRAANLGPEDLWVLGRRVLEYLAPDLAEERTLLEAQENRARPDTRLSFHPRSDGATDLRARIPTTTPPGSAPTWSPSPHPATTQPPVSPVTPSAASPVTWSGCPTPAGSARRSARSWTASPPRSCPGTAAPPPRSPC